MNELGTLNFKEVCDRFVKDAMRRGRMAKQRALRRGMGTETAEDFEFVVVASCLNSVRADDLPMGTKK